MTRQEVEKLLDSGCLPGSGKDARLLETHISWVLLSGPYAIKIKRPVRYSFLDFSSPEARKYYVEQELLLNRRLAPAIYLDTLSIVEDPDRGPCILSPPGDRPVLDTALQMKRLAADRQMDHMLREGRVEHAHLRQLARLLADFHRRGKKVKPGQQALRLTERYRDLEGVFPQVERVLGLQAVGQLRRSVELAETLLARMADRLQTREEKGWVVDGHGDLHSRNIFLLDPPVVFDCIEFDETLRQLDILDELAFFLMDLDAFGQADLGRTFVHAYLQEFPVLEGAEDEALLIYFKMYRANVRLKINCLSLDPDADSLPEALIEQIGKYFQLVCQYQEELRKMQA